MRTKEIIELHDTDQDIIDFLERALLSGPLRVKIGDEVRLVKVSSERVNQEARDFLTKGHLSD